METSYYTGYLTGIMNMASSLSSYIGPSYAKVDCYKKEDFKEEFCKYYKIKENELNLVDTDKKLDTALLDWFGDDKKIIESIIYWFNLKIPGDKKIYESEENLIYLLDKKRMDFYNLEDIFFVEVDKYIFVFLLGNNE